MNSVDPSSNTALQEALDRVFLPVNRSDAPGLVVGVALAGKLLYRRGFGLASIEHARANTPATRMRIGSTSKHFACMAALLLAEEGQLDLDASVRTWVPELPVLGAEPTLRQLMSHTGGLRDPLDMGFIASGLAITPPGTALQVQARQGEANFAPGESMIYNNGGYQLLSLAIERASGMAFERFLQTRLFEPLGMKDTLSVPSDLEIQPGMATMHVRQPDGRYRRGLFPSEEVRGEGAIVSTVDDMLAWLAHLRGPHTVGSDDSWRQLMQPARLNNGLVSRYGLGLFVDRYRGVDVVHHGGTVFGGTCQMLTVPAHALDVIVIANGAPVVVGELANQVVEAVLGEQAFTAPPDTIAETARFAALVGTRYLSAEGLVLGFGDAAGKLGLVIHHSPPIPMRETADGLCLDFSRVAVGPHEVGIDPLPAGAEAPARLRVREAGTPRWLERLPAVPPSLPEAGAALVGRYRAADLDADAWVEWAGEALQVRIRGGFGPSLLLLQAWTPDLFAWNFTGPLAPLGGTLIVERGPEAVTGFRISTVRSRNVRFRRID